MKTINFNLWKFMTILIVISTIWTFCGYFANVVKNVCMKVSKSESDIIFGPNSAGPVLNYMDRSLILWDRSHLIQKDRTSPNLDIFMNKYYF